MATLLLCIRKGSAEDPRPSGLPQVSVTVGEATYNGYTLRGVDTFLGIPFAEPPVRNLRLKPPVKARPRGVFNATNMPHACPGFVDDHTQTHRTAPQEDCLYLNIYRPTNTTGPLPVLNYIFGGGFQTGEISTTDPTPLLTKSTELNRPFIYVTANHRLASFGFLNGPTAAKMGLANIGMKDQRLAMEWIRDHIAAFGGDPTTVTIWGHSSGGYSVGVHTVWEGKTSTDLFRAAFLQSGTPFNSVRTEEAHDTIEILGEHSGCKNHSAGVYKCLQSLSMERFIAAQQFVPHLVAFSGIDFRWLPTVDGDILPESPDVLFRTGKYVHNIPILNGCMDDEGTIFAAYMPKQVQSDIDFQNWAGSVLLPKQLTRLGQLYPNDPAKGSPYDVGYLDVDPFDSSAQYNRLASIIGDSAFQMPRRAMIDVTSRTQNTWSYVNKAGKYIPFYGSYHSFDTGFYYGTLPGSLTQELLARLTAFIVDGTPNVEGCTYWPTYTRKGRDILIFNDLQVTAAGKDSQRIPQIQYLQDLLATNSTKQAALSVASVSPSAALAALANALLQGMTTIGSLRPVTDALPSLPPHGSHD